jgi:ectoine hydroxylase-related dioxygenase (phytanoyl-CoA dioxygenase family)
MQPPPLEDEQINQFHRDGYLIVKDCIAPDDIARIRHIAERDAQLQADAHYNHNHEGDGLGTRLVYRNQLADDVYGAYVRSQRLVTPMQQLFGDKMRHYYHLQMLKDPQTGGWQWHQDYGYHYKEFFYPDFVSLMLPLDPCTRDNGCLRVLRGSHRLGRLEHQQSGSQLIANPERVEWALKEMEEVYCELEPGSLLYFHGNVLHASHSNESTQPRWSLVCAYVTAANTCVLPDVEAILSAPLEAWDDAQVNEATERHEQMVAASRSA